MKLSDYDYVLPKELIAAYPTTKRTEARLLSVSRKDNQVRHEVFSEISKYFVSGDILVLNDTKVIPGRIYGKKQTGGKVEALLLKNLGEGLWQALLNPGGRLKKGARIIFGDQTTIGAEVMDEPVDGEAKREIRFDRIDIMPWLYKYGHMPLPPYIARSDEKKDQENYQTVFAKKEGAVAAPTAGLHFEEELLVELKNKGVEIVYVTLHVGYGTFRSVTCENMKDHVMHFEEFELSKKAASAINLARKENRRVIACGTTSVRTLESCVSEAGELIARRGETNLFIYPAYDFKVVSGLITNFHLPKTTLLLLVDAFLGGGKVLNLYKEAIKENYRFYSYGDAMFIS